MTETDRASDRSASVRMPAEWEPHRACWLAFPHIAEEWDGHLEDAQRDIASFALALRRGGEAVRMLVRDEAIEARANELLRELSEDAPRDPELQLVRAAYGDCWVRDTGCIGVSDDRRPSARAFRFDGWGGKYDMPGDTEVSLFMASAWGFSEVRERADFVLEGGGIETDGEGTFLVTQCVVDRNPGWTRETAARRLRETLGAERVIFAEGQLANDHTDGHIDTIARFVAPGRVVVMRGEADDPNLEALREIEASLVGQRDARGRTLEILTIPSPGAVIIDDFLTPASYCNFYIANDAVLVPAYGVSADEGARSALAELFPHRDVTLVPARGLITGGGALHCASQQEPRPADTTE